MANAPAVAIDYSSSNPTFTPICNEIGGPGVALYRFGGGPRYDDVTVGPICYIPPATGRCGAGGGPDPIVGLAQPFTQECLNHDHVAMWQATGILVHSMFVAPQAQSSVYLNSLPLSQVFFSRRIAARLLALGLTTPNSSRV
jgi:hypothetical protein